MRSKVSCLSSRVKRASSTNSTPFSLNLFLLYTSDLLEMMSSTRSKDLLNSLKLIVSASQTNRCANVEETPVRQRRRLDSYKAAGHVKTSARAAPTKPPFLSQTLRSIESEAYTKFATTPESLEQSPDHNASLSAVLLRCRLRKTKSVDC